MSDAEIINALRHTNGDPVAAAGLISQVMAGPKEKRFVSQTGFEENPAPLKAQTIEKIESWEDIVVPKEDVDEKWEKIKNIGSGSGGEVWEVMSNNREDREKRYALKTILFDGKSSTLDDFKKEVFYGKKAASLGVGPKIYGYGYSRFDEPRLPIIPTEGLDFGAETRTGEYRDYGVFFVVQQLLDMTLEEFHSGGERIGLEQNDFVEILELMHTLKTAGIEHHDLWPRNILVGPGQFYIIDYERIGEEVDTSPEAYIIWLEAWNEDIIGYQRGQDSIPFKYDDTSPREESFYRYIEDNFFKVHWPEEYE